MKWTRIKKGPNDKPPKDQNASFAYFPDQKSLDKEFEIRRPEKAGGKWPNNDPKQTYLWVAYKLNDKFDAQTYLDREWQKQYELFCGGFLHFYDSKVRNEAVDHKLHFEWGTNKTGDFFVSLYIFPQPFKAERLICTPTQPESEKPKKTNSQSTSSESLTAFAVVSVDSIDPPSPPPPPPPP